MGLHKLERNQAFVILDLESAASHVGPLRVAATATQTNARLYARRATYTYAALGEQVGGAAGGVKVDRAEVPDAVEQFCADAEPLVAERSIGLDEAAGVQAGELAPLRSADPRDPVVHADLDGTPLAALAAARSAAATLEGHLGDLDGCRLLVTWSRVAGTFVTEAARRGARVVAVSTGAGTAVDPGGLDVAALVAAAEAHGDDLVDHCGGERGDRWAVFGVEGDVFVPGPTLRSLSEQGAERLQVRAVLPITEQAVPPKPMAILRRRGAELLPDFLTLAGPAVVGLVGGEPDAALAAIDDRVTPLARDVAGHEHGPFIGACVAAEAFLDSWLDERPAGRPLP